MAPPGGNKFTLTFGNQQQHSKEPQQQPPAQQLGRVDGSLRLAPPLEVPARTGNRTLQLFPSRPGMDMAQQQQQQQQPQPQDLPEVKVPLGLVYKGHMHVFEHITEDRAKELLAQAGSWSPYQALVKLQMPAAAMPLEGASNPPVLNAQPLWNAQNNGQYRNPAPADGPNQMMIEENADPMNDEPPASWLHL